MCIVSSETIGKALGSAPCKPTPKNCRDDLNIDILVVVSGLPAERLLPCGMRVINVPNGWTPKDSCDDLEIDVLAVVGSVPAEKFLPCGMRVIKDVVPLSLHPVNCCGELPEGLSNELEERGRRREVVARGPPVAAASDLLPELWLYITIDDAVKLNEKH